MEPPRLHVLSLSRSIRLVAANLPESNVDWDLEISLDIEWAHALAPAANILLVEANSSDTLDLLAAEQYAAENAKYVSNSWGTQEYSGEDNRRLVLSRSPVSATSWPPATTEEKWNGPLPRPM